MSFNLFTVILKFGYAGKNEQIVGGAVVFLIAAAGVLYLSFIHKEMETGLVMKVGGVLLLVLTVLAYFWPMRPWPH